MSMAVRADGRAVPERRAAHLATFRVRVEGDDVWGKLPPEPVLGTAFATDTVRVKAALEAVAAEP